MMEIFSQNQYQKAACLICEKCLFNEQIKKHFFEARINCPYIVPSDEELVEIIAICKWLFTDEPSTNGYFEIENSSK